MSTRSSLVYGKGVHFFQDLMDREGDFTLQLEGADIEFEASAGRVQVKIPAHIWEAIRQVKVDLTYAQKTDAEIRAEVREEVELRMKEYEAEGGKSNTRWGWGDMVYGTLDTPKEVQLELGFRYYNEKRVVQRYIQLQAEVLTEEDPRKEDYDFEEPGPK